MAPKLPIEFRFGGGLNLVDAPDYLVGQGQLRQAENFRIPGHGWISTRRAALEIVDLTGWTVVAGPFPFNNASGVAGVLLEWNRTTGEIRLATLNGSGTGHTVVGTLPGYSTDVGYGANLVQNGGFASGSNWDLGGNAAISGGALRLTPVGSPGGSAMQTALTAVVGRRYRVTYTVAGRTAGSMSGSFGAVGLAVRSSNGTFVDLIEATGTTPLTLTMTGTFDGTIDDVVVEPEDLSEVEFTGAVLGRVLFVADVARSRGLVAYDPNNVLGSGSAMFQPTFDFNQDSVFAVAKPRILLAHENHLWMFGYGDESDPQRGELARFSYLGLIDDGQGSGDAGDGGATGSLNLFDIDDFVPVGPVGFNVISAASAPGRLGYATESLFAVIYGTDRDTWRKDVLDTERGSVATRAMGEGDGVLWWYSPLGPAQFIGGGQALDLSRPIDPRTEEIDLSSLFFVHYPQENQVRWYHRKRGDPLAGADRWVGFNYLARAYEEDVLGYRVFCAGHLLPAGTEGPTAAPSSLTHEAVTENSARSRWVPGDTSPGVLTRVYRAPDVTGSPGTYVQLIELGPGAGEYTHVGLEADTTYWTKVEHFRNGQVSSALTGSFTTNAAVVIPVPLNVAAHDFPVLFDQWVPSVLLSFDVGGVSSHQLYHRIEKKLGAGAYEEVVRLDVGVTSYRDWAVFADSTYTYRVRAEDSETGAFSDYSAEAVVVPSESAFVNYPPDKGWV